MCDTSDNIYVLPSTGVTNIRNIATILIGWGLDFKILLDYDDEGRKEGEVLETKLGMKKDKDFFYLNTIFDEENKDREIEDLISPKDDKKIKFNGKYKNPKKTLAAKMFFDEVNYDKRTVSKETEDNFHRLFEKIQK